MAIYVRAIDNMSNHTSADLRQMTNDFVLQEGVLDLSGGHLLVEEQDTPGLGVKVAAGTFFVLNDSWSEFSSSIRFWDGMLDGETTVSVDSNSSGSTRIDLICIKIDTGASPDANASNVATVEVVKGTPGAGAPSLPSNHLKLAEVSVEDGETTILNADITDFRTRAVLNMERMGVANDVYIQGKDASGSFQDLFKINSSDQFQVARELLASNGMDLGSGQGIKQNGSSPWKTISLNPGFLKPSSTNGCSPAITRELATNDVDINYLGFDHASPQRAFAHHSLPGAWDGGIVQYRVIWTTQDGAAAEGVAFGLEGLSLADNDALDTAHGSQIVVTDTWHANDDLHTTAWSNDLTISGSPSGGDWINWVLERVTGNGSDDLDAEVEVIEVQIRFKLTTFGD